MPLNDRYIPILFCSVMARTQTKELRALCEQPRCFLLYFTQSFGDETSTVRESNPFFNLWKVGTSRQFYHFRFEVSDFSTLT